MTRALQIALARLGACFVGGLPRFHRLADAALRVLELDKYEEACDAGHSTGRSIPSRAPPRRDG